MPHRRNVLRAPEIWLFGPSKCPIYNPDRETDAVRPGGVRSARADDLAPVLNRCKAKRVDALAPPAFALRCAIVTVRGARAGATLSESNVRGADGPSRIKMEWS